MDSISRLRAASQARSGGKLVRGRRTASARTPYDRPSPPSPPPVRSPNWLTGFVFPATRMIANGAGKFLSSVFNSESASSSSSSSDGDSGSEHGMDDDNGYDIPSEELGGVSERTGKVHQQIVERSETKCIIEWLLMKETFSREECNRLVNIINSRVVDCSTIKEGQDGRQTEIPSYTPESGTPDICSKAVREARKWLEEKRMLSSPELDLNYGSFAFNSIRLQKATEGEVGSPVDMAKSYMKACPPWSSPCSKHIELKTPSPMMIEPFKEETVHLVAGNSWSSLKKRDSLATGSWNIHEEIRRVRSKATEDLLRTIPSTKIDLSSYAVEPKTDVNSSVTNKAEAFTATVAQELDSTVVTKPAAESLDLSLGVRTAPGFPDMEKGGLQNEALSSNPATFLSEQSQQKELEGGQTVDDGVAASKSHESASLELVSRQYAGPKSSDENCFREKEMAELRGMSNGNGFPSQQSSLCKIDRENPNQAGSSHVDKGNSIPVEETCELLSEASVEVPSVDDTVAFNESDIVVSGSPDSKDLAQPNLEPGVAAKASNMVVKQHGKKAGRYSRRVRGRGK